MSIIVWSDVDCIELGTVGVDREAPVATGLEAVTRIDGEDPDGYIIKAHSIYVHRPGVGATCIADCWNVDMARELGRCLAKVRSLPLDDYLINVEVEGA